MWLAALVSVAAGLGGQQRALVVHDQPRFALAYSELLLMLRGRFREVDVTETKNVVASRIVRNKEFVYDFIVFAASKTADCLQLAEQLRLNDFFDNGGRVLLLGNDFASQSWRLLLGFFGFDVLVPQEVLPEAHLQLDAQTRVLSVDRAEVLSPELARGLNAGLLFDGRALCLTPRDTQYVGVFAPPPPTALLVAPDGTTHQSIDPTAALVVYGQGRYVKARVAAAGSTRLFSNALMRLSGGDNRQFLENLLDWLDFRSMVVRVQRFAFCARLSADCAPTDSFGLRQPVYLRFQAVDAAGQFLTNPEGFYVQLLKMRTYMTRFVRSVTLDDEPFFVLEFEAFDEWGMYRSKLGYNRPGVYLDAPGTDQELVFRPLAPTDVPIFNKDHLPVLLIAGLVLLSATGVFWLAAAARAPHKWSNGI